MVRELVARGHDAAEYDLKDGADILDSSALASAMRGCEAVVHSAALLGRGDENPAEIVAVNVEGTRNVLAAGRVCAVSRIVFLSSVDVFGVFKGEREPDYLPLDDAHPRYGATPYAISKRLGEEMCRSASDEGGPLTVCLRPPGVWSEDTYLWIQAARDERPEFEWSPFWEYGAFIDVKDLARACVLALTCEIETSRCLSVTSSDITTSGRTSREWAFFVHPRVEWRGGAEYDADPYRSLIRIEEARRVLDWQPTHTWAAFVAAQAASRLPPDESR